MPVKSNRIITIKNDNGVSNRTIVTDSDGNVIKNITGIDIHFEVGEPVTANIRFTMAGGEIKANPFLSIENIKYFAAQHGYYIRKKCHEIEHDFSLSSRCARCGMSISETIDELFSK